MALRSSQDEPRPVAAEAAPRPAGSEFAQEFLASVGAQLRAERLARQLTLQQVAGAAGLTKGFLSQLERGESSVSIASLLGLCSVLGVDIALLVQRATPAAPVSPVVRRADRKRLYLGGSGVEDFLLTPPAERRFEVFETHLEPLGSPSDQLYALDAEVGFALVLKGTLEIAFAAQRYRLARGDSLTYAPREPHTFVNPSRTRPAVVLFANTPAVF